MRHQFVNSTLSPVIFFRLNILQGTAETPAVDALRLNALRETRGETKTAFLTAKMHDEHPTPFKMAVLPRE